MQTVRFGVVSVLTTIVDYIVLIVLSHLLPNQQIYLSLAVASGYTAGTIVHFFIARHFVFTPTKHHIGFEFLMVFIVGITGLGLTVAIVTPLTNYLKLFMHDAHPDQFKDMRLMVAKAIAILIVFCWNFGARRVLIYNHKES